MPHNSSLTTPLRDGLTLHRMIAADGTVTITVSDTQDIPLYSETITPQTSAPSPDPEPVL